MVHGNGLSGFAILNSAEVSNPTFSGGGTCRGGRQTAQPHPCEHFREHRLVFQQEEMAAFEHSKSQWATCVLLPVPEAALSYLGVLISAENRDRTF